MPIATDTYRKVVAAKVFIDGNFQGPVDLDTLAREACISRYHFHRLFTRIYRLTPHQYLTRKRIEQARLCLAARDLSVTEICNHVGFESIGSFSLLFKKEIGAPPTSYRDEAWRRERQTLEQPRSFIPHCFIENFGVDTPSAANNPSRETDSFIPSPSNDPSHETASIIPSASNDPSLETASILPSASNDPTCESTAVIPTPSNDPSRESTAVLPNPSENPSLQFTTYSPTPTQKSNSQ